MWWLDLETLKKPGRLQAMYDIKLGAGVLEPVRAKRYNKGKPQLSYILDADRAIAHAARVFEFGAEKYDRGNWKKGLPKEEVIDSLLRHLMAYQNGENLDSESGLPHVGHIVCNALFLAQFYEGE